MASHFVQKELFFSTSTFLASRLMCAAHDGIVIHCSSSSSALCPLPQTIPSRHRFLQVCVLCPVTSALNFIISMHLAKGETVLFSASLPLLLVPKCRDTFRVLILCLRCVKDGLNVINFFYVGILPIKSQFHFCCCVKLINLLLQPLFRAVQ